MLKQNNSCASLQSKDEKVYKIFRLAIPMELMTHREIKCGRILSGKEIEIENQISLSEKIP